MMRRPSNNETGSVTAELVMALPAVALVISITLGAFALQIERMKLVDVAATAARAAARGDDDAAVSQLVTQMLGAPANEFALEFKVKEQFVCLRLNRQMRLPSFGANLLSLSEVQCARKMGL